MHCKDSRHCSRRITWGDKTLRDIYVEDGNNFSDTATQCNEALKDTIKVLEKYNWRVHKILWDNQEILNEIPIEILTNDKYLVKLSKEYAQTSQKKNLSIPTSKYLGVDSYI